MTVAENVAVQTGYPRGRLGMVSWHKVRRAAIDALSAMGSDINPDVAVSTLAAAERSLVAIGRALAVKSDILVLDEPTAALPEADVSRLLDALRRLRASGIGIIYVTHRLDEVFRIADRVTVLRDGRRVATAPVAETSPADLVEKIVGRSMTAAFVEPAPSSDRDRLRGRRSRRAACRTRFVCRQGRRDAGAGRLARRRSPYDRPRDLRPGQDVGRPYLAGRPSGRSRRPRGRDAASDRIRVESASGREPRRQHVGSREYLHQSGRDGKRVSCSPSGVATRFPILASSSTASRSSPGIPRR